MSVMVLNFYVYEKTNKNKNVENKKHYSLIDLFSYLMFTSKRKRWGRKPDKKSLNFAKARSWELCKFFLMRFLFFFIYNFSTFVFFSIIYEISSTTGTD